MPMTRCRKCPNNNQGTLARYVYVPKHALVAKSSGPSNFTMPGCAAKEPIPLLTSHYLFGTPSSLAGKVPCSPFFAVRIHKSFTNRASALQPGRCSRHLMDAVLQPDGWGFSGYLDYLSQRLFFPEGICRG